VIYVCIHLRESDLNNEFECKNHVWRQKLQILTSSSESILEAKSILIRNPETCTK